MDTVIIYEKTNTVTEIKMNLSNIALTLKPN